MYPNSISVNPYGIPVETLTEPVKEPLKEALKEPYLGTWTLRGSRTKGPRDGRAWSRNPKSSWFGVPSKAFTRAINVFRAPLKHLQGF